MSNPVPLAVSDTEEPAALKTKLLPPNKEGVAVTELIDKNTMVIDVEVTVTNEVDDTLLKLPVAVIVLPESELENELVQVLGLDPATGPVDPVVIPEPV